MKYVSDKSCTENQNTHFVGNNFFFRKLCRLPDNVEKNIVELGRPQAIPRGLQIHFQFAFPLQQWLHERASMLRYTYIACIVFIIQIQTRRKVIQNRIT
jgi:hypothetical protein